MIELLEACAVVAAMVIVYYFCDWMIRRMRINGLLHRYVLITGCDTGFGNMLTKKLDKMGCRVFACCYTRKGQAELKKITSERVTTLIMDVADPESVRQAYRTVSDKLPDSLGLWGLVNNAGVSGQMGPVEWLTKDDYQKALDINLLGLIDVTTVFLPLIKKARGRVVMAGSVLGRYTVIHGAPYCVSKYGVEAFSNALRQQMKHFGVKVSILEPGFFRTNISNSEKAMDSIQQSWLQASESSKAEYGEQYLEEILRSTQEFLESGMNSSKTSLVINAYVHALFAYFPRSRYLIGWDAKFLFAPMGMLPARLSDLFVSYKTRHCLPDVSRSSY